MVRKNDILRGAKILILTVIITFLFQSCGRQEHFITDPAYRELVHKQYLKRMELAKGRSQELFEVMKQPLTLEEKEALEFLYAFMPLSDLANLDGQYFLGQVRTALEARRFFSWGKNIPEDIFRHFVLPYRVNNENPDNARQVFFNELKDRIKNLNMYQAALEVNHWCHEKVTYRATDERTSAPLATVKTAFGRCGEESTFTVAALRAVSIPARQIYTPRWAHTDDNHAWVEVWVDGQWYYLGACEPEPELNMAWFTGPAKRAMMVHTTVFGQYRGPEEVLLKTDLYTKINQLPIYAPTTKLTVVVKDAEGKPVPGAKVDFCLYNYAEFYPVATKTTDENGETSVITGLGDLVVWASKDGRYAYIKVSVGSTDKLNLILKDPDFSEQEIDLDIVPPVARNVEPADPAKVEENNRRLRQEDAIREAYIATFINQEKAEAFAMEKGLPPEQTWKFLQTSRGNWKEIMAFLSALKPEEVKYGLGLLGAITEKDLRDTPAEVLLHHLRQAPPKPADLDDEIYIRFILSPRIGRELITAWRGFIQQKFTENEKDIFKQDPSRIADWIKANIKLDDSNYYNVPLFPKGVLQLGLADTYSMKVLFVAIARTLGIPARMNQANGRPCYFKDGKWIEIFFEKEEAITASREKSALRLFYEPAEGIVKPIYYTHFTLARLENGCFKTLDYENDPALAAFPCELRVDPGYYMLVSGNRQPDGSVLCRLKFFVVPQDTRKDIHFTLRKQLKEPEVLGKLSAEVIVTDFKSGASLNLSSLAKDKSLILVLIEPDKEPTKHLMEEIQALQEQFSAWPGSLVVAVARDRVPAGFYPETYKKLPSNSAVVYDAQSELVRAISQAIKITPTNLPVVVACRRNGDVILYSEGYRIGTGEQLVKTLPLLR
ncbi:MAG: transglutaminase domain-containing protein [Candidatus Aminicenantes bacterium]|nr:transglutaminase domain-containing protein [Candidatus Aminicenantes bacterium]